MSTVTVVNSTSNQFHADYDVAKMFVWNNRYAVGNIANATGSPLVLSQGTILGRIASTGKLIVMKSAAVDGSQYPVGVLKNGITIADGTDEDVVYCKRGDVVSSLVVFDGTDDTDTVITPHVTIPETAITVPELTDSDSDTIATFDLTFAAQTLSTDNPKTYGDLIAGLGIDLVASTEMTAFDNQ